MKPISSGTLAHSSGIPAQPSRVDSLPRVSHADPTATRSRPLQPARPAATAKPVTLGQVRTFHSIPVVEPFRLDLTVHALRRLSTNLVDILTPDGEYIRWLDTTTRPAVVRVMQAGDGSLVVDIDGHAGDQPQLLATVRRMLGVDVDLARFYRDAARIRWLSQLARRMRGMKPPRYPTLWEACLNGVIFQQISLAAASTIMGRIVRLGESLDVDGITLHRAPAPQLFDGQHDAELREAGLSDSKLGTLRRISEEIAAGRLDETAISMLPSAEAARLLRGVKGIGPWTATLILLRGFGRLDVFPGNDSSVTRNLALLSGNAPITLGETLEILGASEGMLYYHLLLGRLEARGALGPARS